MSEFAAVELIMQKREKGELSTAQIDWLIANYTTGVGYGDPCWTGTNINANPGETINNKSIIILELS